ncbi:MAG: hypothetical protein R3325_15455, partial [Thermoanaerobaculia bacterium]|nr:hypothetical protein [Thermoanaerobaculia bacterium]
ADYRSYLDSAAARFRVVFYGAGRDVGRPGELSLLVERAGRRGSAYVPFLAEEYRRVGGPPGIDRFDDRSTAFGIGAVAFSHAVSDAVAALRYLWLEAGGADPRELTVTPPASP